jgi:phospholipase C
LPLPKGPESATTSPRFNRRANCVAKTRIAFSLSKVTRVTFCKSSAFAAGRGHRRPQTQTTARLHMKRTSVSRFFAYWAVVAAFAAAGCGSSSGGGGTTPPVPPPVSPTPAPPGQKIQHVVVLVQENRTVDNLFNGFPGADTVKQGLGQDLNHPGKQITIALKRMPLQMQLSPMNTHAQFVTSYDGGKMDGFNTIPVEHNPGVYVYQYANPADVKPYWDIAKQYVLADRTFSTQGSGSFTAHQDLIAGGTLINATQAIIDNPSNQPWGCDSPTNPPTVTSLITTSGQYLPNQGPFPCLHYKTLRDLLDAKGVSWAYYVPPIGSDFGDLWNAFDAIHDVRYGSEWKTNVLSSANLLSDIAKNKLAAVTWVCPDFTNSDHPGSKPDAGPSWIAQTVDAIGQSQFWNTTAIFVVWDDWGGVYDHVAPKQIDYQGLGFRVPMLVVSPYAKKGVVSHTQYEFGSIVKFVESTWSLGSLGTTDARANSLGDAFDFSQSPRPFSPIQSKFSRSYFLHQRPSNHPVDTN